MKAKLFMKEKNFTKEKMFMKKKLLKNSKIHIGKFFFMKAKKFFLKSQSATEEC